MLTVEEARGIATVWRERFADEASFEHSWSRFFDMVGDPDVGKLERWLAKDQAKDAVKHAGIVTEPLMPVRQRHQLGDCPACFIPDIGSPGFIRRDVDRDHPDFGKAFPCPRCHV